MAGEPDTTQTEPQTEGAPESDAPDLGRLIESFDSFRDDISSRLDGLEQGLQWEPEQEPTQPQAPQQWQPAPQDIDPNTGQLTPDAQLAQLRAFIQQEAEGLLNERMSSQQEAQLEQQRNAYADQLEERIPALRDPRFQEEMVQATVNFAQSIGRPDLAGEPRLLEQLYWAAQAQQRGEQETPADAQVHLETGGSAAPAQDPEADDVGDRIVERAQKARF